MIVKLAMDYYEQGEELYKEGSYCPNWDGTAPTSYIIEGWRQAAKKHVQMAIDVIASLSTVRTTKGDECVDS